MSRWRDTSTRPGHIGTNTNTESQMASQRQIEVRLFGGPSVSVSGAPAEVTHLQQQFLTLVFAHGDEGISRARLGWLLWEQDDHPRLRQRIRQLLHRTSERLGADLILSDGDLLKPGETTVRSDIKRFEHLLQRGPLAEAAGILSKGFANRIPGTPSREFEDWRIGKETAFIESLRRVSARRWDETSEAGLWGDARDAAEALYIHFPDDPTVAARVVEARARTGSLASAEHVCARLREDGGGGERVEELETLIRRAGKLRATRVASSSEAEPRVPLVGRKADVASAVEVFDDVARGEFRFALISGEGGIGKTRVLEEVAKEAVLAGFRCLHARPVEPERRIPLNPLADAFAEVDLAAHLRALGAPWRSVIASLLPVDDSEPIEEVPPIQEAHLSRRLMDALFLLMERVASEEPTILFIDDLQWADATTITALQFIQRRWEGGPLGIIAAVRPDAVEASEPARKYLQKDEHLPVTRIELEALSEEEGQHLVNLILGDAIDPLVRERLCELGGLHPLYVTELCRDYRAGRLRLPELPVDEVAVPVSLQEIFRRRLDLLSAMSIKVAGILAVRGRAMRLTRVAELTGLPLDQCADCAEELKELRLVELAADRVGIAHELFRSALYQSLSEARRAVLHRSIAEHLSETKEEVPEGELAMHFARAGEAERAVKHGWVAAKSAIESAAMAEAAYFFELVMQHESDPVQKAVATAELARALHLGRSIERANPVLELAAARLRQTGNPNRALRMDIRRVEGLAEADAAPVSDLLQRLSVIKEEARSLGDWEALALALDVELHLRHAMGDLPGMARLFDDMRRVVRDGTKLAGAIAHSGLAVQILFGDHRVALEHGRLGVRDCDPSSDHRLQVLLRLLLVLQYQGRFYGTEAQEVICEARGLAKKSGDLVRRFSLESNIAVAHLDSGNLDAAEVAMARSTAMLGNGQLDMNRFNQAINAGELALAQGDFERARQSFKHAERFVGPKTPTYSESMVMAGLGLSALETGDLRVAKAMEAGLPENPGLWYFDPTLLVTFKCRMCVRRGDRSAAIILVTDVKKELQDRLVLAWLKLTLLHADLVRPADPERAAELAREGYGLSKALQLDGRARQFDALLRRLK